MPFDDDYEDYEETGVEPADPEEWEVEEEEETLEELDVDERGHVRPRRRSRDIEEFIDEYE